MTIKEAIQKMMDFYKSVETIYANLPDDVEVATDVKDAFQTCLNNAGDAYDELDRMQTVGVNCTRCKFSRQCSNACADCMFEWVAPTDQRKPLNYEPA